MSSFYYLFFRDSLFETTKKFTRTFLIDLAYVIVPLLPVGFTLFWRLSTLHGTVCFLKMEKRIKKFLNSSSSSANCRNDSKLDEALFHRHHHHQKEECDKQPQTNSPLHSDHNVPLLNDDGGGEKTPHHHHHRRRTSSTLKRDVDPETGLGASSGGGEKRNSSLSSNDAELASIIASIEEFQQQDNDACELDISGAGAAEAAVDAAVAPGNSRSSPSRPFFSLKRIVKPMKFYLKVSKMILLNDFSYDVDPNCSGDDNLRNAAFIYYSNFLIGLGIITVC